MIDTIKNNELLTTFSPENVRKIPAEILYSNAAKDFLFFHMAFEGLEIIALYLIERKEWFYGIYHGSQKVGFLYYGGTLTVEQQQKRYREYLPEDVNKLPEKVKIYEGDIDFHRCGNDAYCHIGNINLKKVIQPTKTKAQ